MVTEADISSCCLPQSGNVL